MPFRTIKKLDEIKPQSEEKIIQTAESVSESEPVIQNNPPEEPEQISEPAPEVQETQEPEKLEEAEVENVTPEVGESEKDSLPEEIPEMETLSESEAESGEIQPPQVDVQIEEPIVEATPESEEIQENIEEVTLTEESEISEEKEKQEEKSEEAVDEPTETENAPEVEAPIEETQEPEVLTPAPEPELAPEDIEDKYNFTSNKRYVDEVSTKTEFDKVLDSLAAISKDLLSHEVERFAKKYADKYQGDFTKAEADAKKYEAFLGGYITNAAMTLYENNYMDAAIRQLDQAKNVLIATQKLKTETSAINERVVEEGAAVDLSDILGMFGDG